MSNTDSNTPPPLQQAGAGIGSLLSTLQQGVAAINRLTQTWKTIFPSTS